MSQTSAEVAARLERVFRVFCLALSDGPNMIPLGEMDDFLKMLLAVWQVGRQYTYYDTIQEG